MDSLGAFMMDTGPKYVFNESFVFDTDRTVLENAHRDAGASMKLQKEWAVVARREGSGTPHGCACNVWHNMAELMSYYMSLDILAITPDATSQKQAPMYDMSRDVPNTQVIVTDDWDKGPFWELWNLFSLPTPHPILKLSNDSVQTKKMQWFDRALLPLPGGSNPFWEGTWNAHHCSDSDLAKTFRRRVLDFYGFEPIPRSGPTSQAILENLPPIWPKPQEESKKVTVTIVDRKSRRIGGMDDYVSHLRSAHPYANITLVDFADISFREQVELVARTDVFVGVHGAAMTHVFFLTTQTTLHPASTVVEILPNGLGHRGYRNLAQMMGHRYFSVHAENDIDGQDFHDLDLVLGEEKFAQVVGSAIMSALHAGLREEDVTVPRVRF